MVHLPDVPRRFRDVKVFSVVPCVVVHSVRKLFGFPRDNTGEFRVNLSSLDKVLANKTIERLDESVAKDVTVSCNSPWLDLVRGGAKFWGLAQHSFQLVRDEQRILCMFLVKDVVDSVASASKLQLLQGHAEKFALNQCFQGERHPVSACNPRIIQYPLPRPRPGPPPRPL